MSFVMNTFIVGFTLLFGILEIPAVREEALYALGEIGGDVAAALLRRALADDRDFIRQTAAELLEELASEARDGRTAR